jgi:hypothetical protein
MHAHLLPQRHACDIRQVLTQLASAQQQPAHEQRHAAKWENYKATA